MYRVLLFGGVVAVLAGAAVALGGTERPRPSTLVVEGRIQALAQDGSTVAWIAGACPGKVATWNLRTGKQATLALVPKTSSGGCWTFTEVAQRLPAFALAGNRVLWSAFDESGHHGYGGLFTAAPGERATELQGLSWENYFWGDYVTGVVGDGATLAYSTLYIDTDNPNACARGNCVLRVTGGAVKQVVARSASAVPGVTQAAAIAVADTRIAVVPVGGPYRCTKQWCGNFRGPRAKPNGTIEIRDVGTGELVSRFSPTGSVKAIALAPKLAVVLVQRSAARRIELYDVATGALVRSTAVPTGTAPELGVAGLRVVFRAGKAIWLLDAESGKKQLLRTASATPVGLSIEGRRVAWAENISGQARVQVLVAP